VLRPGGDRGKIVTRAALALLVALLCGVAVLILSAFA
jgi:hypothetical protein